MESILDSTKKSLGINPDYTEFDDELIDYINTAFSMLRQLGVGPESGFIIIDKETKWEDILGTDIRMELVKSYVHKKVRLMFDPPASSIVLECTEKILSEIEWRILLNTEIEEQRG